MDSGIRHYPGVSSPPNSTTAWPLGITAWPRCQSMRQGGKQVCRRDTAMSESKIREEICRLRRSLFEPGLTAGSSGHISVGLDDRRWLGTPAHAAPGSLDPAPALA